MIHNSIYLVIKGISYSVPLIICYNSIQFNLPFKLKKSKTCCFTTCLCQTWVISSFTLNVRYALMHIHWPLVMINHQQNWCDLLWPSLSVWFAICHLSSPSFVRHSCHWRSDALLTLVTQSISTFITCSYIYIRRCMS